MRRSQVINIANINNILFLVIWWLRVYDWHSAAITKAGNETKMPGS